MATKRRNSRQRKSVRRGRRTGGMNLLGFLNPKKKGGEDEKEEPEVPEGEAPVEKKEGMFNMFGTKEPSAEAAEEAVAEKPTTTTPVEGDDEGADEESSVQEGGRRRRRRATRRVRRRKVRRTARRVKRRVRRRSSRRRR
tara:strand:- start:560 stop:979 length:420 start_codon:yes stop_codon:yes gene_type:complete